MKSTMSKKEIDNGKASAIFQQMKNCCLELGLNIRNETVLKGELGIHAKLDVEDVRVGFSLLYIPDTGQITLIALHYGLTDHEWNAVYRVIPMIHKQHDAIKACASPDTGLIGCTAELTVECGALDAQHFRQVLNGVVMMSRCISRFACGLRDCQEGTAKRTPSEILN